MHAGMATAVRHHGALVIVTEGSFQPVVVCVGGRLGTVGELGGTGGKQ